MKKLFISALSMLAVAMGFTACTSDDDVTSTPDTPKQITVYATTEQPSATRTSLNVAESYEVLWSAGDQIKLINEASIYAEFTLDNDYAGQSTGEFTGSSLNEGTYTAYYPAGYDGTNWPTAQTYVANNIPDGVPMKAENVEVADGTVAPISFKNEGGILRLNLKGEAKVTSITISATDLDAITLSCGTAVQLDADMTTPFYIAVPGADDPGTAYSGLKIVITDDAGKVCTKTAKVSITVQRSMITDINLTASSFKAPTTGTAPATNNGVATNVKWIQLWKDGPKFAEFNVGAENNKPEDFGSYLAVSDLASKIPDLFGDNWRLPTLEDYEALLANCTYEYINGEVTGSKFIGKGDYSSNSIFLPIAGYMISTNLQSTYAGFYWTSTPIDDGGRNRNYNHLQIGSLDAHIGNQAKTYKETVRLVLNEE